MLRDATKLTSLRRVRRILLASGMLLACGDAQQPPDVVLITVDTLRADHVSAYGAPPANTPHIDRLAREGTVFERAAAPMPLTRPTHASILTGRYPREHGVVNNALSLPGENETLAEILQAQGYRTGAFVSVSLLSGDAGFPQGFEIFQHPSNPSSRRAEDAVPEALRWLDELGSREPFFLWLHLFDPHLPYAPPPAHRRGNDSALEAELPEVSWMRLKQVARKHDGDISARVLSRAQSLYRGEVSYTDEWIGHLLDGLESLRPLDRTLIVFTADHGECFGNGVYFEHADCLQEGALRVPLIVRYPPVFPAGARVASQASSIDVAPTVLRSLGFPIPTRNSGRPLQELDPAEDRYVLVQHPLYPRQAVKDRLKRHGEIRSVAGDPIQPLVVGSQRVGVVGSAWKYLRGESGEELHALDARSETPAPPETTRDVRARLAAELDRQLEVHPLSVLDPAEINDELRETLRALGYLSGEPETAGRPAPAQVDAEELARLRALGYVNVVEDAVDGPDGVIASDPTRVQPGLTYFTNAHGCSSHLIDADGTLQRSWSHEPCDSWDNSILLPSGEVLAVHRAPGPTEDAPVEHAIVRLSWEGALLSQIEIPVHHDLEITPTGLIAAMTYRHRLIPEFHPSVDVRDHGITILEPDGTFAEEVLLVDLLRRAPGFRFEPVKPKRREGYTEVDLMHSNSVEFIRREALAAVDPLYAEGNVLVTIRNQDSVIMLDWSRRRLLWAWGPGEIVGPHDATLLENGNILIFDNRPGQNWSRVVEVDPRSDEIVWEYRAPVPEDFYSLTRGAAQRLENGNTLITDSAHARIFEVTRDGEVVWDYRNAFRDEKGRPVAIVRARRVRHAAPGDARFEWSD